MNLETWSFYTIHSFKQKKKCPHATEFKFKLMIPMFGNMSDGLRRISGFLFTGVVTKMTDCFANGVKYTVEPLDIAVLFGELIISALVFLVMYRRNGYEKD